MRTVSPEEAVGMIPDGARLMVGEFMAVGTPERLNGSGNGRETYRCCYAACCQGQVQDRRCVRSAVGISQNDRPCRHRYAEIGFPDGRATLMETAPGVSVAQVVANIQDLIVPTTVPEMAIGRMPRLVGE